MSSNTLRFRGGDAITRKNTSLNPVSVLESSKKMLCKENEVYQEFFEATPKRQLLMIKDFLFDAKQGPYFDTVKFLVIIYLQSDSKHPFKSMISRFVCKNNFIQKAFTEVLTKEIEHLIDQAKSDYKSYEYVVSKLMSCMENFPSAAAAMKNIQLKLADYFKDCLRFCVDTLSDDNILAATEKNEIFSLSHSTLRLILYTLQRITDENKPSLILLIDEIRINLKYLLFDIDVPMDTKSLCGILFVSMHVMENDNWKDILLKKHDDNFKDIFNDIAATLCIYSALVTVIPIIKLKEELCPGEPAIVTITNKILEIGDRCSTEVSMTVGVTRALVAVSRFPGAAPSLPGTLLAALCPALDHRADAVRHLAANALRNLVRYCETDSKAMDALFSKLVRLDKERKSYYVSITLLTNVLGADCVIWRLPRVIINLLAALRIQAVQASTTIALETLLEKHIKISTSEVIYKQWIDRIIRYINTESIDSAALNILENLLVLALKLDGGLFNYILPQTRKPKGRSALVCAKAMRRAGFLPVARKPWETFGSSMWNGALPYVAMQKAAADVEEENRILFLSLIVESPKTTELFEKSELDIYMWFLKYNINAQEPHFRQQVLSLSKKFIKRVESSYKVLLRKTKHAGEDMEDEIDLRKHYVRFMEILRQFCFKSLVVGANYGRRHVALQLLLWATEIEVEEYDRDWKEEEVETILHHLGDSYEENKVLALELLSRCPAAMLKSEKFSKILDLANIIAEASSIKPTDCVTAVYKLKLVARALPENIVEDSDRYAPVVDFKSETLNRVKFGLLYILLAEVDRQVALCKQSIVLAARRAPLYGLLHCVADCLAEIGYADVPSGDWSHCIHHVVDLCEQVWDCTAAVLSSAAPEGHLPTSGHQGTIVLENGKEVTAQMVLLCAWRSIKEVSQILGSLVTLALLHDKFDPDVRSDLVRRVGSLFITLLTEIKHRGAFEQVYVGFTKMLTSLWRSRIPEFNELPKVWLEDLMSAIESGDPRGKLCATRRSAGLPFMIQALVITELQVKNNSRSFDDCVTRLLRLAAGDGAGAATGSGIDADKPSVMSISAGACESVGASAGVAANSSGPASTNTSASVVAGAGAAASSSDGASASAAIACRCHALNTLRALVRDRALQEHAEPHAARALQVALQAFERDSWAEHNSATLLFSALMVRIFGVQRSKDSENLSVRNRMTGRIFFLRYPKLYDFILNKLKEVGEDKDESRLRPSLYPILLLLARLYPSSLEGTVSNLKLSAFVPLLRACAGSAVLTTRRLAARAFSALVEPERYVEQIEETLELINNKRIKRNYCHGLLLQLIKLLESKPEKLTVDSSGGGRLQQLITQSQWILQHSVENIPCYLIVDEYIKMVNVLIWRFSGLIKEDFIISVQKLLKQLIFNDNKFEVNPGREVCLANAAYLEIIILHKYDKGANLPQFVYKCLEHKDYEVTCAALTYLMILTKSVEPDNNFERHINEMSDGVGLFEDDPEYIENLLRTLKSSKCMVSTEMSLKLLTLKDNTAKVIVAAQTDEGDHVSDDHVTDDLVVDKLVYFISTVHDNLKCYYLSSLCGVLLAQMKADLVNEQKLLEALRVMFSCILSNNVDETKLKVIEFLSSCLGMKLGILDMSFEKLNRKDQFEGIALPFCIFTIALNDDWRQVRDKATSALMRYSTLHTKAPRVLFDTVPQDDSHLITLTLLALLNFNVEVTFDDLDAECRVFDQNEKYNTYLEETIWTRQCAWTLMQYTCKANLCEYIYVTIMERQYSQTFLKLCGENFIMFEKYINTPQKSISPRVKIFIDMLKEPHKMHQI